MSNITSENYHQLMISENGELIYDVDDFPSPPDSPRTPCHDLESKDTDIDMGCSLETIEQMNFSGLGLGGIVAEKVTGPLPAYLNVIEQQIVIPDTETHAEWNSMINDPDTPVSAVEMPGNRFQRVQLPVRTASRCESFPRPVQTELQAAADTPRTDSRSLTISGGEEGFDTSHNQASEVDTEMKFEDDSELAAAADVLSLEPPFWDLSSSDASDDKDDTPFANNGWADAAELMPGPGWTPEQQLMQELGHAEPHIRTRGWVRRGAVGG